MMFGYLHRFYIIYQSIHFHYGRVWNTPYACFKEKHGSLQVVKIGPLILYIHFNDTNSVTTHSSQCACNAWTSYFEFTDKTMPINQFNCGGVFHVSRVRYSVIYVVWYPRLWGEDQNKDPYISEPCKPIWSYHLDQCLLYLIIFNQKF